MKKWLKWGGLAVLVIFALIGLVFAGVFIAMQFGWFNVRGSSIERDAFFFASSTVASEVHVDPCLASGENVCAWDGTPEWAVVAGGLTKDAPIIQNVAGETGVSARLIASVVVPEQIRFFTSERDVFKSYFEPLKILGSLSQFSLGVSGIKQATAVEIEESTNDPTSPFYPGAGYASLIAYTSASTTPQATQLYNRLTDPNDHYYSYLYTALYIREIESQWASAGFPIDQNPGIVGTLFNIGFQGSHPNASPQVAGAAITTGGMTYSFGQLGADFYNSNELRDILPN